MMDNTVLKEQVTGDNTKFPVLFELGLRKLIKAKSDSLFELRELELKLLNDKHELAGAERNLLLNTDFKELGLTNEKMRNAYINEELNDLKTKIDVKKHSIESKKDTIELINDLIRLNELEMKGE